MAERLYRDAYGNTCTLLALCRKEPEWAANTIEQLERELGLERTRCVTALETDLKKWREHLPRWAPDTRETIELCIEQVEFVIDRDVLKVPDRRFPP